jgi:death on curing protein
MKEPVWVEEDAVLTLHDRLLALHGGAPGIRDFPLLQSALARPRQYRAYAGRTNTVELAAAYTTGIVRNHPFVDGNKRTGFVVGILFLELNGYRFIATEESATQAMLDLAAGALDEDGFKAWLRANVRRELRKK